MYQALYRKWRPRVFADVVGQEHVTRTLRKQVAEGHTSHAYLFTGTRGTGKTTCAKILARAVNCEHPANGDPCGVCPSCVGLENESFMDVLELDAASNNGVDQVRALRDEAVYSPANVKKRVYIIDEVHMLSVPAFNALLKILEEPPEHLMFILATTELHKVPATILSRCQRYAFRRIRPQDIQARLAYVAQQEGIALTEDGAELLSRLADGALRDGLSLLDQCAAAGGTVDAAAVLEILGLAGRMETAAMLEQILRRETSAALLALGRAYDSGKDVGAVLGELSDLVRDLLILRTAPEGGASLLSGGYDAAALDRLGGMAGTARLLYLASTLRTAAGDLYNSANRRTDAELCILRLCDETLSGGMEALAARVERLEGELSRLGRGGLAVPAAPPRSVAQVPPPMDTSPMNAPPMNAPPRNNAQSPPPMDELPWDDAQAPPPDAPPWDDAQAPPPMDAPPWDDAQVPPPDAPPWDDMQIPPPPPTDAPAENRTVTGTVPTALAPPPINLPTVPQPANPDRRAIPRESAVPSGGGRTDAAWWQGVLDRSCGKLPPMNKSFLKRCEGVREGDLLTVCAPDSTTLTRLNNDRVKTTLLAESGAARIIMREGPLPPPAPDAVRTGTSQAVTAQIETGQTSTAQTGTDAPPNQGNAPTEYSPSKQPPTEYSPSEDTPANHPPTEYSPSEQGTPSPEPGGVPPISAQSQEENLRELVAFSRQHSFIQITGGGGTAQQ